MTQLSHPPQGTCSTRSFFTSFRGITRLLEHRGCIITCVGKFFQGVSRKLACKKFRISTSLGLADLRHRLGCATFFRILQHQGGNGKLRKTIQRNFQFLNVFGISISCVLSIYWNRQRFFIFGGLVLQIQFRIISCWRFMVPSQAKVHRQESRLKLFLLLSETMLDVSTADQLISCRPKCSD